MSLHDCHNCKHDDKNALQVPCKTCRQNYNEQPSKWEPIEDKPKPQTGYAVIPMDEYLFLFTEIAELRKENSGLKAELETTERFLSEATMKLENQMG